jgi:DNA polymerase-3 subunit delta'
MKNLYQVLSFQVARNRLSHAYLVFDKVEIPKIARIFQTKPADILILEEPIKINQIRELIHWAVLKPHSSIMKLAFILGAENMTLEANNALLKILEEPPKKLIIILEARKLEKILPTILSRCQIIKKTKQSSNPDITGYLNPALIGKKSIKERFNYVNTILENEEFPKFLNLWEIEFRERLKRGEDVLVILKQILRIRRLLSTNISLKLLL